MYLVFLMYVHMKAPKRSNKKQLHYLLNAFRVLQILVEHYTDVPSTEIPFMRRKSLWCNENGHISQACLLTHCNNQHQYH